MSANILLLQIGTASQNISETSFNVFRRYLKTFFLFARY